MRDISVVIIFLFLLFGIAGLQFFVGPYLHTRCRLTPFPVTNDWQPGLDLDYNNYKCNQFPNFDYPGQEDYKKSTSPWAKEWHDCYWPVDEDDTRFCTLTGAGLHKCANGVDTGLNMSEWRWCGSNYDALGNSRFGGAPKRDNYNEDQAFGIINFDNFGMATLSVFVIITANGWTDVMYFLMDSVNATTGAVYATLIILFGSFFILQLIIATLENSLQSEETRVKKLKADKELKKKRIKKSVNRTKNTDQNFSEVTDLGFEGEDQDSDSKVDDTSKCDGQRSITTPMDGPCDSDDNYADVVSKRKCGEEDGEESGRE